MNEENDKKLVKAFPLLYGDRSAPMQSTAMCWGFSTGNGWFDIIWDLSSKLEPLIQKFIDDNPLAPCGGCSCKKERHYGWKSWKPGKCLAIHIDPESGEEPPNNYFACFCDEYRSPHPKASQVKEKFGGLRFYMTTGTDEMFDLIDEADTASYKICEECASGDATQNDVGWIRTLCESCRENYDKIREEKWKTAAELSEKEGQKVADLIVSPNKKRSAPFVITDYLNSADDIAAYVNAAIETGDEAVSKDKHPPECKWHKDWHACDCGAFEKEEK